MAFLSGLTIQDGANLDAFGRLRTSSPLGLFDAQFTYNLRPTLFEQIASGTGATIAHDGTNRCALMTFNSTPTGGKAFMQSFEYVRYQPGRSQEANITFNMIETKANVLKFAGLSDGTNGIEFQLNGTTKQVAIYSATGNGNQTVAQASWNLDTLDGNGPSGLTLDVTKTQILVIDLQALYVGRVRIGFNIDGILVYVHQFVHANRVTTPYLQYASLPVRCGMTCTGTVSTTMNFICSAVLAEGGQEDVSGLAFSTEATVTAGNNTETHALSIRPKGTFNSLTNRSKIILDSLEVLVTGNAPVKVTVCFGQATTGASYADVNTTYSSMEVDTAGTLSGAPAIVTNTYYIASSSQSKGTLTSPVAKILPITLDAAGATRANGTVTVRVYGVGAASACRVNLEWRELR